MVGFLARGGDAMDFFADSNIFDYLNFVVNTANLVLAALAYLKKD